MRRAALAFVGTALTALSLAGLRGFDIDEAPERRRMPRSLADLPPSAQAQISETVGRDQRGYHASPAPDGYRLQNSEHALAARFTPAGLHVSARAATWGLSLAGYGYGSALSPVSAVAPHATANRVEYRRGELVEWYVNGPLGLEQGFTLAAPPRERTGGPLTLAFALSGDVTATVSTNRRDLNLARLDGTAALRYRGLTAFDAARRELPAWLELSRERLLVRVDDAGARYPVVVDPFIEQAKLTASDGEAGDLFGSSAIDGDILVVGAPGDDVDGKVDQGSAYVFVRPAGGWGDAITHQARLIASDGQAGDVFGAVAVSGDTIVVGAMACPNVNVCNTRPVTTKGAAYVFVKPAGGWNGTLNEQARLTASDGAGNDLFGAAVSIDGDTIVVSAEWDDFFRGSAYVFRKPDAGWSGTLTQNAKLIASDRSAGGSGIGHAFSRAKVSGDIVVAGAIGADVADSSGVNRVDAGRAYVFVKPAGGWSGVLTEHARLIASDRAANDRLGNSIALGDDTVVVGAPFDSPGATGDHGAAYVFVKPDGGWAGTVTESAKLVASDQQANDNLGVSVGLNADIIFVGAPAADSSVAADTGAVYLFERPPGGWIGTLNETGKLTAADGAAGDTFGGGVTSDGHILVVGARRDDAGAGADQGSAYVFLRNDAAALTLSPSEATNPVGTDHTIAATVHDMDGLAVPDMSVRFAVTGTVTTGGVCTTDSTGSCAFTYTGPSEPGVDAIAAFADADGDGVHDAGEPQASATKTWQHGDRDGDGIGDHVDNCVDVANVDQTDTDGDGQGNACDADDDNDGVADPADAFPLDAAEWIDTDGDGTGNNADPDDDNDGQTDADEAACGSNPLDPASLALDTDGDARPDCADEDDDNDGVRDAADNCVLVPNPDQTDTDRDGAGDLCDATPGSTPGRASGGGFITGARRTFAFAAQYRDGMSVPEGHVNYVDREAGIHLTSTSLSSLRTSGGHAVVTGDAFLNGMNVLFEIEAIDVGEPGREDSFTIRWPGYEAGSVLRGGNVQVREK